MSVASVVAPSARVAQPLDLEEEVLAPPQGISRPLALVDVDEQVVPADDLPVRIPKRKSARLKPPVDAIETSRTHFELERLTGRDRATEEFDDPRKILGMCHAAGSPVLQLLQRLAEVLDDRTVDEFELAPWRKGRDEAWNAVDDEARLAFAFTKLRNTFVQRAWLR